MDRQTDRQKKRVKEIDRSTTLAKVFAFLQHV